MNHRNFLKCGLLALLIITNVVNAVAEHQEGSVTRVARWGGNLVRLRVFVDTTGNRIPDTILQFLDPGRDYVAQNLEAFIERGMKVTFDDDGYFVEENMKIVSGHNTKTIDGDNMIIFFPNERERFKFAIQDF
jgi:hypothetical protein